MGFKTAVSNKKMLEAQSPVFWIFPFNTQERSEGRTEYEELLEKEKRQKTRNNCHVAMQPCKSWCLHPVPHQLWPCQCRKDMRGQGLPKKTRASVKRSGSRFTQVTQQSYLQHWGLAGHEPLHSSPTSHATGLKCSLHLQNCEALWPVCYSAGTDVFHLQHIH